MPELPDVQVFKEYVDATALHRHVDDVYVDPGPELAEDDPKTLISGLLGDELSATHRHGKHLFARIGDGKHPGWLHLHFGMTGSVRAWKGEEDEQDEHVRLRLDFDDGWHLAYRCPRRLGEIGLVDEPASLVRDRDLGPDPWPSDFDQDAFRERLAPRRGRIKTTLMNQEVLAGLGNIYVDEMLFQAGVDPETKVPELDDDTPGRLFDVMKRILRRAVDARVDPDRVGDDWLLTRREDGAPCPLCDGTIRKKKVGGRSTYVCTSHQRG